jgi:hypothetical protein
MGGVEHKLDKFLNLFFIFIFIFNQKESLRNVRGHLQQTLKLKWGDIQAIVRDVLTAMISKDKQYVCTLTQEHKPPAEGNSCDECNRVHNLPLLKTSQHMGYVNKGDRMENSYLV